MCRSTIGVQRGISDESTQSDEGFRVFIGGELETSYDTASSGWKKEGGRLVMTIEVPPNTNTTATIEFPNGRKSETVVAGTHRFEL